MSLKDSVERGYQKSKYVPKRVTEAEALTQDTIFRAGNSFWLRLKNGTEVWSDNRLVSFSAALAACRERGFNPTAFFQK